MGKQAAHLAWQDSFGYILARAARTLGGSLNRSFVQKGIAMTCEQWSVLVSLSAQDGQTQVGLASQTCKDKTSMTRLIDTMEKHGLVARIANDKDRREKRIILTKNGKQIFLRVNALMHQQLKAVEAKLPAKDVAVCKRVLCQVYEILSSDKKIK